VLTIETARLAARQKDSARVAGDLLSVSGVKIRGQPVRGPGDRGPGVGFPTPYSLISTGSSLLHSVREAYIDRRLGPNFRNFPKTFSKDLPMSDDLGIPKKFSYPNF